MDCSLPGSSVHGDSPGKNTGEGYHFLLQGIFLTQELNPNLLHCRQILYRLSYKESPRSDIESEVKAKVAQSCPTLCDPMDYTVHGILQARLLEWVAFPFSRGSSQVSCIAGGFFYQLSHEGSLGSEMARTKNGQT